MGVVSQHEDMQERLDDAERVISHLVTPTNNGMMKQEDEEVTYAEPHNYSTPEKQFIPIGHNTKYTSTGSYQFSRFGRRKYYTHHSTYARLQAAERQAKTAMTPQEEEHTARGNERIPCKYCPSQVRRKDMTMHTFTVHRNIIRRKQ